MSERNAGKKSINSLPRLTETQFEQIALERYLWNSNPILQYPGPPCIYGRMHNGGFLIAHYVDGTVHYHESEYESNGRICEPWYGRTLGEVRPSEGVFLRYTKLVGRSSDPVFSGMFEEPNGIFLGPAIVADPVPIERMYVSDSTRTRTLRLSDWWDLCSQSSYCTCRQCLVNRANEEHLDETTQSLI